MAPPSDLLTPRLWLRASDPALAAELAAYLGRNRQAHAPWNPPMPDHAFTAAGQRERLAATVQAEAAGTQRGWFLCPLDDDARVIGHLRFSQIARGPFHNAMLGYAIDAAHEGQGLMHEALCAALAEAFGPRMGLHRVQANVRPENRRSLALLDRLGFEREGIARQYLYIDGAWRDHLMTALRHPHWPVEQAPA
jgi:ribosomal-protein-alanine N-acetyltransferase